VQNGREGKVNEKKEMNKSEKREKFKVQINKICRIERRIKNNLIVYENVILLQQTM
jgi:hypothetical protein